MGQLFAKAPLRSFSRTRLVPKPSHRWWWFSLIVLALLSLVLAATITFWWFMELPLASPLNQFTTFQFLPNPQHQRTGPKNVYGFLPYWNLNSFQLNESLTHVAYFSLAVGSDGSILVASDGEANAGYRNLQSETFLDVMAAAKQRQAKVELVLTQFAAADIENFLASTKAQDKLIASLDSVLLAYPINGINLDFEHPGDPSSKTREQFTAFVAKLRQHLNQHYRNINLSFDAYASGARSGGLWDVAALAPHIDFVVIMAYDFHRQASPQAGPVAPIIGGRKYWDSDIITHLKEYLRYIPPQKVFLGIPFYGYEWQTTSREAQSATFPNTGRAATYERIKSLLSDRTRLKVQEHWNDAALSPYLSYEDGGLIYLIYYENSRSLSYKLDLVNDLDLGGVAIWALGYEGEQSELWDVINNKLIDSP